MNALKMDRSGYGLGVMQHVEGTFREASQSDFDSMGSSG